MRTLVRAAVALGAIAAVLVVSAGAGATTTTSYLIVANGNASSAAFKRQVEAAGGTVTNVIRGANVAVVSSARADFAQSAASLGSVAPNLRVQWIDPARQVAGPGLDFANPPTSGDDDFLFDLQWGHDAIDAVEAWNAGHRGAGARVAVLDTGYDLDHPDLAPNVNMALSKDFTGEGLQYTLPDVFSHGTHVAGTVAAADNAFGTIGVAPDAELVLVKVLFDEGWGTFEDVIEGIVYAAGEADADVINMSLGAVIPKDEPGADALKRAMSRATNWAYRQGALVIAAAGNDALDRDANPHLMMLPADSLQVVQVSALGPLGWGLDPTTNLDEQAFYTNYGRSKIDHSAPGGNLDFTLFPSPTPTCTIVVTRPCWVFDLVFSVGNGGWFWAAGTSMAAPHAAGAAAIVIGANGGEMRPARVRKALNAGADDLGPHGRDPVHGRGRINAAKSV